MGIDAEMFVKVPRRLHSSEVRKEAIRIAKAFPGRFFVMRPEEYKNDDGTTRKRAGRHALSLSREISQDGPKIHAKENESFVVCHLWGRYYGEGYERGDLASYIAIARWLKGVWPDGKVYYGGDSSGVLHEEFTAKRQEALWKHFMGPDGGAYYDRDRGMGFGGAAHAARPTCDFCKVDMNESMWGGGRTGYYCPSCTVHCIVEPGGKPTWLGSSYDSFDVTNDEEQIDVLQTMLALVCARQAKVEEMKAASPTTKEGRATNSIDLLKINKVAVRAAPEFEWTVKVEGKIEAEHDAYELAATMMMQRAAKTRAG